MPAKTNKTILQSGGSKVIALPPDWLRALNLDVKDSVDVLYNFIVLIKPRNVKLDRNFLKKELDILASIETEASTPEGSE